MQSYLSKINSKRRLYASSYQKLFWTAIKCDVI